MTEKEMYTDWCDKQSNIPMFLQPWWMDAVCAGKQWNVILVYRQEIAGQSETATPDEVVAAMPYLLSKRLWMTAILMPQETPYGGIWIAEDASATKVCEVIQRKLAAMNLCYYYQQFVVGSPCPPVMKALQFKVRTRNTYQLCDLSNLDNVIDHFSKNKKRQLQKALSLHAERGMNVEAFYRFHMHCMEEQKKKLSYTREFLLVLERKTKRLEQSDIIQIKNADGLVYAAAYVVWDDRFLYYLMPCYDPAHKESGAGALLALEAIKLAREKGVSFDFEGSMNHGIANHYKQFGSSATTYYSVSKLYKWYYLFALLGNKLRNLKYGM